MEKPCSILAICKYRNGKSGGKNGVNGGEEGGNEGNVGMVVRMPEIGVRIREIKMGMR